MSPGYHIALLYIARLCLIIKGYMSSGVYPTVAILAYFDWVHEWRKQNVWFRYMFLLLGKSMWLLLYMFMFSPNLWIEKACETSQTQHGYNYYMRPRLYIMILIQYHMTSPQNGMIWVTICIMVVNPVINPPFEDYFLHSYGKWSFSIIELKGPEGNITHLWPSQDGTRAPRSEARMVLVADFHVSGLTLVIGCNWH